MDAKPKILPPPDGDDDEDGASMQGKATWNELSGKIEFGKLDLYSVIVVAILGVVTVTMVIGFVVVKVWGKT